MLLPGRSSPLARSVQLVGGTVLAPCPIGGRLRVGLSARPRRNVRVRNEAVVRLQQAGGVSALCVSPLGLLRFLELSQGGPAGGHQCPRIPSPRGEAGESHGAITTPGIPPDGSPGRRRIPRCCTDLDFLDAGEGRGAGRAWVRLKVDRCEGVPFRTHHSRMLATTEAA